MTPHYQFQRNDEYRNVHACGKVGEGRRGCASIDPILSQSHSVTDPTPIRTMRFFKCDPPEAKSKRSISLDIDTKNGSPSDVVRFKTSQYLVQIQRHRHRA
jgi:hypothetical protein